MPLPQLRKLLSLDDPLLCPKLSLIADENEVGGEQLMLHALRQHLGKQHSVHLMHQEPAKWDSFAGAENYHPCYMNANDKSNPLQRFVDSLPETEKPSRLQNSTDLDEEDFDLKTIEFSAEVASKQRQALEKACEEYPDLYAQFKKNKNLVKREKVSKSQGKQTVLFLHKFSPLFLFHKGNDLMRCIDTALDRGVRVYLYDCGIPARLLRRLLHRSDAFIYACRRIGMGGDMIVNVKIRKPNLHVVCTRESVRLEGDKIHTRLLPEQFDRRDRSMTAQQRLDEIRCGVPRPPPQDSSSSEGEGEEGEREVFEGRLESTFSLSLSSNEKAKKGGVALPHYRARTNENSCQDDEFWEEDEEDADLD